jgi:Mg/Co/Ni transporter MgtE
VPSKEDWLARGLPTEGRRAGVTRVGSLVRDDIVTCRLGDRVDELRPRVESSPYDFALVTTERGTLFGRLRASVMEGAEAGATAESLMDPGPATMRPDRTPAEVIERLDKRDLRTAVVSTPEGRLIGVITRDALVEVAKTDR